MWLVGLPAVRAYVKENGIKTQYALYCDEADWMYIDSQLLSELGGLNIPGKNPHISIAVSATEPQCSTGDTYQPEEDCFIKFLTGGHKKGGKFSIIAYTLKELAHVPMPDKVVRKDFLAWVNDHADDVKLVWCTQ